MTSGSACPPHAATAIAATPSNADNVSVFHVLNTLKILPYVTNQNKPQSVLSCRNVCADAEIATTPDKYRAVRHVSSIDQFESIEVMSPRLSQGIHRRFPASLRTCRIHYGTIATCDRRYAIRAPPSTGMTWPVMFLASSETRNAIILPISDGSNGRLNSVA